MTPAQTPETWHLPRRPGWDCTACKDPWPCTPAKADLAEEYGDERSGLVIYLALQMIEAIDDMAATGAPAPDLYSRFIGWVKHSTFPES